MRIFERIRRLLKRAGRALGVLGGVLDIISTLEARHFVLDEHGEHLRMCDDGKKRRFREILEDRRFVVNKVVTDDFCEFIVDQMITETSAFGDFKYHHSGTGVGAEGAGDAGLGTPELDARTVGTQAEASSKVYQSVATETFDDTAAITEHGLFNTAGAGGPPVTGGILADRTKFAAINVVDTNQIQWTFTLAYTSGG